ncbi:MAG: hypothetical protein R3349_12590, partial [Geminicoccaceae bacterium]|nr:hypothetical protein [Geminicoccaceae bacterium]
PADLSSQGIVDDALAFVDGFAGSISRDLQGFALDELIGGGVEGRAFGLCAAQSLDEFDDLIEFYVRLGTGRSLEGFAGDQLEGLRDDARAFGEGLWTGTDAFVGDAISDVDDVADRVIGDAGEVADDVIDDIGDVADEVVGRIGDFF